MKLKLPTRKKGGQKRGVAFLDLSGEIVECIPAGYTRLDKNPDILTACRTVASLIGMMTIHLMANTEDGDRRIINELSRKIDINPNKYMTRSIFIENIIMNALLYGAGNAVVRPHTKDGVLDDFEIIQPSRLSFIDGADRRSYSISIDRMTYDPEELIHFRINPDPERPWLGQGLKVSLKDVAAGLQQANATKNGFMKSKWKPSIIVKVDGLTEEFASKEGRRKLLESYADTAEAGEPWLIPAEQFSVEQVRPLSLADLAIIDTMTLDKRTVAAIIGVPPFVLGVGDYNADAWNNFINSKIKPLVVQLQQEMSQKLIISPKMYLRFNSESLVDWDLQKVADVYFKASDRGFVTGNEVRDKIHMEPREGLNELRTLENYIPNDKLGDQKKLIQEE